MIFIMAWRNIWRNRMRSLVIMLSVAIGLFAGMAVLALYKGMLESRVRVVIDAETSHIQMHLPMYKKDYQPGYTIPSSAAVLQDVQKLGQVKYVSPRSITWGMLATTTGSAGVQINGINPSMENRVSGLSKKIIEGRGFDAGKKNSILIGKKLADKLKLHNGSKLVLTFTDTTGSIVSSAFRISGIYQSANAPLDELNVYVPIQTLNDLLLTGSDFHELAIILKKDDDLENVQQQLKKQYPQLIVENWKELSPETELMVKTVDEYSYIIMIIILLALAFGIVNTMLMSILERTREIGMMVALGTKRLIVFIMVMQETIMLTIAGMPFGLLAAWLSIGYYNRKGLDLSGMGKEMMASFGFSTMVYPSFPSEKLAGIILLVAGTALISCLFPAFKALKMQPVEALRR